MVVGLEIVGALSERDPGLERYLARVALAPVMRHGFYDGFGNDGSLDNATVPDIPAGEDLDGGHYSWLRFSHHRDRALEKTGGPFTTLDLCCAVPYYAELHRARNFANCLHNAETLVGAALASPNTSLNNNQGSVDDYVLGEVQKRFHSKAMVRHLLVSHVRRVLYGFDESEVPPHCQRQETEKIMRERLRYEACYGKTFYTTPHHSQNPGYYEGRLGIDTTSQELDTTLVDLLADFNVRSAAAVAASVMLYQKVGAAPPSTASKEDKAAYKTRNMKEFMQVKDKVEATEKLGELRASNVLKIITDQISHAAVQQRLTRSWRVMSVDIADPLALFEAAESSFDAATRADGLYHRARHRLLLGAEYGGDHYQANIFSQKFWDKIPDDSIAFMTNIEGFPFQFLHAEGRPGDYPSYMQTATNMYRKLQQGGYMIFFPWEVQGKTNEWRILLENVIRLWQELPFDGDVAIKLYRRDKLARFMTDYETSTVLPRSPIFLPPGRPDDLFELMVVQKLHKRDTKRH